MQTESLPPSWALWAVLVIGIIASLKIARALTVDLYASEEEEE